MKKLLLAFGLLLAGGKAFADSPSDWNYIPISSFTDAATPGPILFTSATIQFVGVSISSGISNSYLAIFRSTTPIFTADIATQTIVATDMTGVSGGFTPLFEMKNTSFTYISKVGNAQITIWLRCPPMSKGRSGLCPGLPWNGSKTSKIEFLP